MPKVLGELAMDDPRSDIIEQIRRLKAERDAIILAHNYQTSDIQDIADVVGDSLALARAAAKAPQSVIVFCGVHFMAESASILCPTKTVLLPAADAGCPMADMVDAESLRSKRAEYPEAAVVCYVNSSAEVKAESDICCTSANAVRVVASLRERQVIFVPDQNLASYVASQVDKEIIAWPGFCPTHHRLSVSDVSRARAAHPDALVLVHPEVRPEVAAMADFVGSTSQIIKYAAQTDATTLIIGTEMGTLHKLQKDSPGKRFFLLSPGLVCPNMKKTTLALVRDSLVSLEPRVTVDEEVRRRAVRALERMIEVG